jgi:hypothetical protein
MVHRSMSRPVIAILLDACEPAWLEDWLAAGDLPVQPAFRPAMPAWWNW